MGDGDRWRNGAAYSYALPLDDPEWAWEFLRRNRHFREAIGSTAIAATVGDIRQVGAIGQLEAWGLHFRARRRYARRPRRRVLATRLAR